MKTLTQTVILGSAIFAATAFASVDGLNPPKYSTQLNMTSHATVMADQHYSFTGIYDNVLSSQATERHFGHGVKAGSMQTSNFCLTSDLSVLLNSHSVENHLGAKQC